MSLRYLPEALDAEKIASGRCGVAGCTKHAVAVVWAEDNGAILSLHICSSHLSLVRRCETCLSYDAQKGICRNSAPEKLMIYTPNRSYTGPNWAEVQSTDWCVSDWMPKNPVSLEELANAKV